MGKPLEPYITTPVGLLTGFFEPALGAPFIGNLGPSYCENVADPLRNRSRGRRRWWLLGAFAIAVGLARLFLFDIRRIPTPSMAPTLLGELRAGDRVLVDRVTPWLRAPRRFELVAFRHPEDAGHDLVKRVVGLPGERIRIFEGDVFVNGERLRKDRDTILRMRVPLYRSSVRPIAAVFDLDTSTALQEGNVLVAACQGATLPDRAAALRMRGPALDGFELDGGGFHHGDAAVFDLLWEAAVVFPEERGSLVLEIGDGGALWLADLQRAGTGVVTPRILEGGPLVYEGRDQLHVLSTGKDLPWPSGQVHQVSFWSVDCRLLLLIDGVEACPPVEFEGHRPWNVNPNAPGVPPCPRLVLSVYGGGVRVTDLAVYRDLHYVSRGLHGVRDAYPLGPTQTFVLGDHSTSSQDSRDFGGVEARSLLGLVRGVVYPWSRIRSLP